MICSFDAHKPCSPPAVKSMRGHALSSVQVWDAIAQRIPERARWIRELGAALEEREEGRRAKVEKALVDLVSVSDTVPVCHTASLPCVVLALCLTVL